MSIIQTIESKDFYNSQNNMTIRYTDDCICTRCGASGDPKVKHSYFLKTKNYFTVILIKTCMVCGKISFSEINVNPNLIKSHITDISDCSYYTYPHNAPTTNFSSQIKTLSPKFIEIFQQAENTENDGYNEICGMGYRKALEFLIKDYLIYKYPDNIEKISKEMLSQSIKRIEDAKIKILAERCAWIGNDECHYVRKHEDYSIVELKLFIKATLSYIESDLVFEKALSMVGK